MNRSAVLGFMLAIFLPVTGYVSVKYYSNASMHMPGRFFYDGVLTSAQKGKLNSDTLWHQVDNSTFTNQLGKTVSLDSLKGKIIIISFFLTGVQLFVQSWQQV